MPTKKDQAQNPAQNPAAIQMSAEDQLAALLAGGSQAAGLPSMMDAAINKASEGAYTNDDNIGSDVRGLPIMYAAFPQAKGAKFLENMKYFVYVGDRSTNTQDEENYFKELPILWVDALLSRPAHAKPVGGRLMWPFEPNGQRSLDKDAVCISDNGLAPRPQYIGAEVFDFRRNAMFKIGYERNPEKGTLEQITDPNTICAKCPAANWIEVNGRRLQMCKNNWGFVVYSLIHQKLVKISGNNAGVQMALEGRQARSYGAQFDGSELPGIERFFRPLTGHEREMIVALEDLTPLQRPHVVGASASEDGEQFLPVTAMLDDGEDNPLFAQAVEKGFVRRVLLKIPTYHYAPNGRPEVVGNYEDAPVFPVFMTSVKNNFMQGDRPSPTAVPMFRVGDTPIPEEDYAQFLLARAEYTQESWRDILMGMNGLERLRDSANSNNILVSNPTPGMIPANASSVAEEAPIDADFLPVDD